MVATMPRCRRMSPIVIRYETPILLTIVNMFKLVHFKNEQCACIEYLKLGEETRGSGHIMTADELFFFNGKESALPLYAAFRSSVLDNLPDTRETSFQRFPQRAGALYAPEGRRGKRLLRVRRRGGRRKAREAVCPRQLQTPSEGRPDARRVHFLAFS